MKPSKNLLTTGKPTSLFVVLLIAALLASPALSRAATIDFEQINLQSPFEGLTISNQFQPHFGVQFRRSNNSFPVIARVGPPYTAFERNGSNPIDTPAGTNAAAFGEMFLTDTVGEGGGMASVFMILEFDAPVATASGYILDIDNGESVAVRACADTNGANVIATLAFSSGQAGTGDGVGTFWEFARPSKDIRRIEIQHSAANGTDGARLGYDLFASDYTPSNSPPQLGLGVYPGIHIQGEVGHRYQIDYADKLDITPGHTNWHVLTTNLFLPTPNYLFIDTNAVGAQRFYRAAAMP